MHNHGSIHMNVEEFRNIIFLFTFLFTVKVTPKLQSTLFTIHFYWAQNNLKQPKQTINASNKFVESSLMLSLCARNMWPNTNLLATLIHMQCKWICPKNFWSLKMGGLYTKSAVISKRFTRHGWLYPHINADSLHFNLIVILSFQIQSAGVQRQNNKHFTVLIITLDVS